MQKNTMYQVGTINSLLEAVYAGDTSIAVLKQYGNFGLGALDNIDGELVACDGEFYRANAKGELNIISDLEKTPFAIVNKFIPDFSFNIENVNFTDLEKTLLPKFPSLNLIYAMRIQGNFHHISLRSEECTQRPYQKLVEILPHLQHTFFHENINGMLVGVWFPNYLAQLNVPGFHFHFVDDKRKVGGHVFGIELNSAIVEIQILHQLHLSLMALS